MLRLSPATLAAVTCAVLAGALPAPAAETKNLPLPEMAVRKAAVAPIIDGRMSPGEWDAAPAATAFVVAFHGELAKNQTTAWVTYDEGYFYVCLRNNRGPYDDLLSKRARADDDAAIVFDHSNEVWFTPPVAPAATYQSLFNAYPAVFDVKMIPSVGYTAESWRGGWAFAASETGGYWIVEGKLPLKSMGYEKIADGSTWRALFTTDVLGKGGGFRAWAPGGGFAEIDRHGYLHFRPDTAVFQFLDCESIFTGKFTFPMAVTAPAGGPAKVAVTVRCGGGLEPAEGDLLLTRTLDVPAGKREAFTMSGDLTGRELPVGKFTVQEKPRVEKEFKHGLCEVTARAGEAVLYHQVFPFVIDGTVRQPPKEIKAAPYDTPFGLEAFYAPLSRKLLVKIDRYYLRGRDKAVAGDARLLAPAGGKAVAERPIAAFRHDLSQFPMDLGELAVPVQTEKDWADAQPAVAENKMIEAENRKRQAAGEPALALKPVPGPQPAEYSLAVRLKDAGGGQLAEMTIPVKLIGYQFEWLGNQVGMSEEVIEPWTPIRRDGTELSMWNKTYRLNALGLAERIVNDGQPQLSGPMALVGVVDGKEVHVSAGPAEVKRLTGAAADLAGKAALGDIAIDVFTRVEFDGFVLNRMRLTPPAGRSRLERLSLVVTMPAAEAPCLVTTAGGWSAYHGWTPESWDSRETSSGSRVGNFVPYVFLTDSDRGFCWFADTDEGWLLDPAKPTQELSRQGETVTLRINFVTAAGALSKPTTIEYGWMVTPAKPQPPGWRATHIEPHKPYPRATCVFYNDADWAVLWPYYSSPYPRSYEKSAKMLEGPKSNGVVPHVGNIAHAIARYCDCKGRWFTELAADWGSRPGDRSNGNVARSRGPNDFQVWHFDRWVKQSGLPGIYFDENYLSEDYNYLTGRAYLLPDERVQPGYTYLGLREYDKRLRYMFHANGLRPPYLWLHTTSGQPVYAWMPDVAMEGENVAPTSMDNDYMTCLPASRLRSIGMGRNLGAAAIVMCQADRHWNPACSQFMVQQFVGWVLAHDCLSESSLFWPILAAELEMWHEDIRFLPYWKGHEEIACGTKDVLVSAHARGGHSVLWIVNTARDARKAEVALRPDKLGLDPARTIAFDAETGDRYALRPAADSPGRFTLAVDVPARMWRAVRLMQPKRLTGGVTFLAHFDGQEIAAEEAFGNRYTRGRAAATVEGGKTGRAVPLDQAVSFDTRHHVTPGAGSVAFALQLPDAKAGGTIFAIDKADFALRLDRGKLTLRGAKGAVFAQADLKAPPQAGWHDVAIRWTGREFAVSLDGADALTAKLDQPVPVGPMGRGLEIRDFRKRIQPTTVTIGPIRGALMDDLVMAAGPASAAGGEERPMPVSPSGPATAPAGMQRFVVGSPFGQEYTPPVVKEGKQLWARSFLWEKAPDLVVEKWLTAAPDTKGKYLLIEFWATWCPPCRRSIPLLNRLHEKFAKELVVIGISDQPEADVRKLTDPQIRYHSAIDTKARMKNDLGVFGIPHVILVEPGGYVVWEGFPLLKGHELTEQLVDKVLAVGRKSR